MIREYRVDFEQDPTTGEWTAAIDRSQGVSCVTQGPTLDDARARIREALALYLGDPEAANGARLVESIVPGGAP